MNHDLDDLRKSLDNIDNAIFLLFAERFRVTQKVGEYKKVHKLPSTDKSREASQFARIEKLAKETGLNPEFARKLLRMVIDEVVKNHMKLISL